MGQISSTRRFPGTLRLMLVADSALPDERRRRYGAAASSADGCDHRYPRVAAVNLWHHYSAGARRSVFGFRSFSRLVIVSRGEDHAGLSPRSPVARRIRRLELQPPGAAVPQCGNFHPQPDRRDTGSLIWQRAGHRPRLSSIKRACRARCEAIIVLASVTLPWRASSRAMNCRAGSGGAAAP